MQIVLRHRRKHRFGIQVRRPYPLRRVEGHEPLTRTSPTESSTHSQRRALSEPGVRRPQAWRHSYELSGWPETDDDVPRHGCGHVASPAPGCGCVMIESQGGRTDRIWTLFALAGRCLTAISAVMASFAIVAAPANGATNCDTEGSVATSYIGLGMTCSQPGDLHGSIPGSAEGASHSAPAYADYRWASVCAPLSSQRANRNYDCGAARVCPDKAERLWQLWGQLSDGGWSLLGSQCFGRPPTAAQTPRPQVTPALVLQAIRRVGLPALETHTQPADKTLVNFDTIFYTEPRASPAP